MARMANSLICWEEGPHDPQEAVRLARSTGALKPLADKVNRNEGAKGMEWCRGQNLRNSFVCVCVSL